MEQRQEKSAVVLKYGKRRYDGGTEIELIRAIERQKTLKQLNHLQQEHLAEVQMDLAKTTSPATNPITQPAPQAVSQTPPAGPIKNKFLEALLIGPMEICVGAVGMLTAGLAITAFSQAKNEAMLTQSRQVLGDCFKTFKKGFVDTLFTPIRVLQIVARKP